jgi:hypothetical protein
VELVSIEESRVLVEEKTHAPVKDKTNYFKKKTMKIRTYITKTISPWIYDNSIRYKTIESSTPRPMIQIAKEHFSNKSPLVGAEIGVDKGKNALSILQTLSIKKLYLIDIIQTEDAKMLRHFGNIQWLIMKSEEAHREIHENLDFCYIDGNHEYPYVWKDLVSYYSLLKPNGLIGGHDYWQDGAGVKKAVNEFAHENGLKLNTSFPDFWIAKP